MPIPESHRVRRSPVAAVDGEPVGIPENDVVRAVKDHLEREGWTIVGYCVDSERGYDIEARKDERHLVVEAKGTRTAGKVLIPQQQRNAYAAHAIAKAVMLHSEEPPREVVIAMPDDRVLRQEIAKARKGLGRLGIRMMWVRPGGEVVSEP